MKEKIISMSLVQVDVRSIFWTIGLIVASVAAPALLAHTPQNQWLTGTLVNAILFLAAWRVGLMNAFFVGAFPSSMALLRGLLPAPMALLIPYIILSNVIMITIAFAVKKNPALSVVLGAVVKFSFLFALVYLFSSKLSPTIIYMFGWPQLITALAGGFLALGIKRLTNANTSSTPENV